MFIILETRTDLGKICKKFAIKGFDCFDYTDVRGFVGGITMGWKMDKIHSQEFILPANLSQWSVVKSGELQPCYDAAISSVAPTYSQD